MASKAQCKDCRFWQEWATTPIELSECRRHAPLATGGLHTPPETLWPRVKGHDWCGDFEAADIGPEF